MSQTLVLLTMTTILSLQVTFSSGKRLLLLSYFSTSLLASRLAIALYIYIVVNVVAKLIYNIIAIYTRMAIIIDGFTTIACC